MNPSQQIIFFSNNISSFNSLIIKLNKKIHIKIYDKDFEKNHEDRIQTIILGCDYNCDLRKCLNNFINIMKYGNIPSLILRPILSNAHKNNESGCHVSILNGSQYSDLQNNILTIIKNEIEYNSNFIHEFHISNPVYKIIKLQNYLLSNYQQKESLVNLALKVNMSPTWLSQKFKNISEISLKNFILKIKFCNALWQISSSDKQIKTIAYELGYQPLSFSKRFHAIFGISPSLIRKDIFSFID